jgi:hypothetical protein
MYEHRLAPLRNKKIKMLEIGLGCEMEYGPGASYYTWLEYFPHIDLYYIESDAICVHTWANITDKATIFAGDQADTAFLAKFLRITGGDFDIIIDNGGHRMKQQKLLLKGLWPSVKPSGIYFIEGLATSYQPGYWSDDLDKNTMMNDLKTMLDEINRHDVPSSVPEISDEVVSFEFTEDCVALTKSTQLITRS